MRKGLLALMLAISLAALFGDREVRAAKPCVVPREWGTVKGMALGRLGEAIFAFEAADGTIRTVPAGCKTPAEPIDTIWRP